MRNLQFEIIFLLFLVLSCSSAQQKCVEDTFTSNRVFVLCNSLSALSASLHWTYHPSNGTADIAYRAPQSSSGWIGWGLNPTSASGMAGTQALLAFPGSDGAMAILTTPLASTTPTIQNTTLSYTVYAHQAEYLNGVMTIYATIALPGNGTKVNQVWQTGTAFDANGHPASHPTYEGPYCLLWEFRYVSGQSTTASNSRQHRKNTHGVLNAVSWGILMPTGAIIARYLRVFKSADPAWFYLHIACQISAYIVGVAGWGLGLKLGSESKGITYHGHRNIGIALFCLATLQVFALLLRPNKNHKHRMYWNIYHHLTGNTVIVLSVVNIFKGIDILHPNNKWKHAYIGIIATLGGIALVLEAVTWVVVLKRKSRSSEASNHGANGTNDDKELQRI